MDPRDHSRLGEDNLTSYRLTSPLTYEYWCGEDDDDLSQQNADDIHRKDTGVANGIANQNETTENDISAHSGSSGSAAPTVSRRRKKPKGFPKRPLSGYNIFFKEERVRVLEEFSKSANDNIQHGLKRKVDRTSISFQDLGKIIGKRWKALSDEDRRRLECLADQDNLRYRKEMDEFNENKRKRNEERSQRALNDSCFDVKPSSSSNPTWNTVVLSNPSELNPSFRPARHQGSISSDGIQSQDYWQNSEHQTGTAINRAEHPMYPIPPGMVVMLPDGYGIPRSFEVQYKFYKMPRRDAEVYMNQLSQTPTVTPYGFTDIPPLPPGASPVPYPF